jgi:hypothetical protein
MKITYWQRAKEPLSPHTAFISNLQVTTAEDGKPLKMELDINRFDEVGDLLNISVELDHIEMNGFLLKWDEATTNYEAKRLYEDMTTKK